MSASSDLLKKQKSKDIFQVRNSQRGFLGDKEYTNWHFKTQIFFSHIITTLARIFIPGQKIAMARSYLPKST